MMCNCRATEIVLGLVMLVFALWETMYSKWIIAIAAIVLIIHGFMCPTMAECTPMQSSKPTAKKKVARKKAMKKK